LCQCFFDPGFTTHFHGWTRRYERRRLAGTNYCLEHLIAERFGRHLSKLEQTSPGINIKNDPL